MCRDGAANFTSTKFDQWCQDYLVNHITSSVYHIASNGKTESAVKIIKTCLRSQPIHRNSVLLYSHTMTHPFDATYQLELN